MATRKLKETANAAPAVAVAMPEGAVRTVPPANRSESEFEPEDNRPSYMKRDWKPFIGNDELPSAEFKDKVRSRTIIRGGISQTEEFTEHIFIAPGEGRYKVTAQGELIKIYRKRGGTGTKLVYQFKKHTSDTKESKEKNAFNKKFRDHLRRCAVPGA